MEIRRVQPGEGAQLRELRLRALAEAPRAFATSLADAEKVPTEAWEERARRHSAGERDVMFVAIDGQHWCGLAGGWFPHTDSDAVQLFSMWVDPRWRSTGVAQSLIECVVQWAGERDAGEVQLWVTRENEAARAAYRKAGFVETANVKRLPSNEAIEEILMRLPLASGA